MQQQTTNKIPNTVYHAPYIDSVEFKQPIKVYIQKIANVRGATPPKEDVTMDGYSFWINEKAFDEALEETNRQFAGKISFEKATTVIPKGSIGWRIMSWSPTFKKYIPYEKTGTYRKKEYAEEQCRGDYLLHREYLSIASKKNKDKIGLPEPAFVDFMKPNTFREFIG